MSETKKRRGWLPPRTGGYVPTRKNEDNSIQSVGSHAAPPKGGGGVGNIHLKKRDVDKEAE